jgi:LysM repeat protein
MKYTIKRGDTLSELAEQYGTTVKELMRFNPRIQDPDRIIAGESLNIPGKLDTPSHAMSEGFKVPEPQPLNVKPEMFPGVSPVVSQPQQDAWRSQQGMAANPESLMLPAAGAAGAGLMKAIPALARAAPAALPTAGITGNAVKGAVNWPGAAQSMSNVAPLANQGATNAILQAALRQRAMQQAQAAQAQRMQQGYADILGY